MSKNTPTTTFIVGNVDIHLKKGLTNNNQTQIIASLEQGADPNIAMEHAIKHQKDWLVQEAFKKTINPKITLELAIQYNYELAIKYALLKGANPDEALKWGISNNSRDIISLALSREAKDLDGALNWAAKYKNQLIIEDILKKEINPDIALKHGIQYMNDKLVKEALKRGVNPDIALKQGIQLNYEPAIKAGVKKGANPNEALEWGVKHNREKVIEAALLKGANPNEALEWGIRYNNKEIISQAVKHGAQDLKAALNWGISNNSDGIIYQAVKHGAQDLEAALNWGLKYNKAIVIEAALLKGANPDKALEWGISHNNQKIIYQAVSHGAQDLQAALSWAVKHKHCSMTFDILEKGLTPDILLYEGIKYNDDFVICSALFQGANPSLALHWGVSCKNVSTIREALAKLADPNIVGNNKLTAACVALEEGEFDLFKYIVNLPKYNINADNIKDGQRLIDFLMEVNGLDSNRSVLIEFLRKLGSFEPKKPVIANNDHCKIHITLGNAPDSSKENIINVDKILKALYEQFPVKPEEVEGIIAQFISETGDNELIISNIKDLLSPPLDGNQNGITVSDTRFNVQVTWNPKLSTATIIKACTSQEHLKGSFLIALSELNACSLGRLINLLNIAQNALEVPELLDREVSNIEGIISYVMNNPSCSIEGKEEELFKFCQSMAQMKREEYPNSPVIQTILSGLNTTFVEIIRKSLPQGYKNILLPSEMFNQLHKYLVELSIKLISGTVGTEEEVYFSKLYSFGADQYFFKNLMEVALSYDNIKEVDDTLFVQREFNYGRLQNLSSESVQILFREIARVKGQPYAKDFIKLLKDSVELNRGKVNEDNVEATVEKLYNDNNTIIQSVQNGDDNIIIQINQPIHNNEANNVTVTGDNDRLPEEH